MGSGQSGGQLQRWPGCAVSWLVLEPWRVGAVVELFGFRLGDRLEEPNGRDELGEGSSPQIVGQPVDLICLRTGWRQGQRRVSANRTNWQLAQLTHIFPIVEPPFICFTFSAEY